MLHDQAKIDLLLQVALNDNYPYYRFLNQGDYLWLAKLNEKYALR